MRDEGPRWHPQLLARETSPAHWVMLNARDKTAGTIELRRTNDGVALSRRGIRRAARVGDVAQNGHGAASPRHHFRGRSQWWDQRFVTSNEA
jgi:hypothetical protein